ncbi:glycosyltransferase family 2 protein [Planctomycetota bacterium]
MPQSQPLPEKSQTLDRDTEPISLSVFFPCYNEQANVARVTAGALEVLDATGLDYEIILVNDGSADDTARIVDELAEKHPRVRTVHHQGNQGYGAALQSGFRAAQKSWVFYTDGDGQFDLTDLPPLLKLVDDCDIVSCYRRQRQDPLVRKLNGWLWTQLVCLVFGMRIRDIDCAFKLYRRHIFDDMPLVSTGALIDAEVLARAHRMGCRILQRPVTHLPRIGGEQTGANLRVILRAFKELWFLRQRIRSGD